MRKIILISFFLINSLSFAQSGWILQNPLPFADTFFDINFFNQNTGFACTSRENGFLKTTDAGQSWTQITFDSTFNAYKLFFLNSTTGWVSGGQVLMRTTNAGTTWQKINSQFRPMYAEGSFYFVNSLTGYSVSYGIIYKTTDGGYNWSETVISPAYNYGTIFFTNELTGITTYSRTIYRTTNGGTSWNLTHPNNNAAYEFTAVDFINSNTGFFVSNSGYVSKTTNGGINIDSVKISNHDFTSVKFLDSQTGYITGDSGTIFKTTNQGLNWIKLSTQTDLNLSQICFTNSSTGYTAASAGIVLKTTDAGATWQKKNNPTENHLLSVDFVDQYTGYAGGIYGTFLKTTNGGVNWAKLNNLPADTSIYTIYFFDAVNGFIVTGDNLRKTSDGGNSWSIKKTHLYFIDRARIEFQNQLTGWVNGDSIYKTTDGGNSWKGISGFQTYDFHFFDEQNAASCFSSNFYKTTNTGANWTLVYFSCPHVYYATMHFINNSIGYAALDGCSLVKSTNGGLNWNFINPNPDYYHGFSDLRFFNENTGFVSTYNGLILKTTNGGFNLQKGFQEPSGFSFNAVDFINENTGWVVGAYGIIYKTTTGGNVFITQSSSEIPDKFSLSRNYPNPFNPSTRINYELKITNYVTLKVFDLLGKEVASLVNEKQSAGSYAVDFNSAEYNLPSGIYFYTLIAGGFKETKKMVLIK